MALARAARQQLDLLGELALLAVAACALALMLSHPPDATHAAPSKPVVTFSEFYSLYLEQHSHPTTKLLHAVGTSLVILGAVRQPRLVVAGAWASVVGLFVFRLCIGLEHGFLEFGAAIATALVVTKATTGGVQPALVAILVGYGFAWGAHRFVELNRPATFIYPIFSLWGDFRMLSEVLCGAHDIVP